MEKMAGRTRQEKENVLLMLDDCICRVFVSDDELEIVRLIGGATRYLFEFGCNNIRRIMEDREVTPDG